MSSTPEVFEPLGFATLKREGAKIPADSGQKGMSEPTYWFEQSFTKAEFAELAAALAAANQSPLVADLAASFARRAVHGDDLDGE